MYFGGKQKVYFFVDTENVIHIMILKSIPIKADFFANFKYILIFKIGVLESHLITRKKTGQEFLRQIFNDFVLI